MQKYNTEYKDYSKYVAIMVSTDQLIFNEKSSVRMRMVEYSKLYKELHIIIFSTKLIDPIKISQNCTVYSTKSIMRLNYVSNARKIGRDIVKNLDKEDQLLVSCQNPFETALAGKNLANMKKDSEFLIQLHTDMYSPYFKRHSFINKVNLFISRFTLPHAQVVRVVSRKIADSLVDNGVDPEKIIIKPIEVDVDYIKNTPASFDLHQKYPQFKKIILMVCRLESEKNMPMALEALKIIKNKITSVGLVVVGSGSAMSMLKKQAYKLKIDDSVVFAGWQTDSVSYYKGCDVFLMTSFYEGYGMVLKEAQAAGCKIVSTDVGIAHEVGASIADWNPQSIADKLITQLK